MSRLNFNFLCFIIFQACFGTVGNGVWDRYVSVILCVLALFLLFIQTKFEFCRYYKKINWLIFLYCAYNSIISAIGASADLSELQGIAVNLTKDFEPVSKFVGISFGLKIFVLFLLIEFACTKNLLGILIRNFLILFCLLLLVNDFLMLIKGVSDDGSGYLLGNKFQVSYMHFWLLMLFYAKNIYYHTLKPKNIYLLIAFCALIVILVGCTTALVGVVIVFFFFYYRDKSFKMLYKPSTLFILLAICSSFFFVFGGVLENNVVRFVLVDVLGEDPTLTGRMGIYQNLVSLLSICPFWGYGIHNSHFLLVYLFGASNAQNGLLDVWIEQGFIGTTLLLFILFNLIKHVKVSSYKQYSYPIIIFIYIYVFLSSVEVTMNINFVLLLSFLIPFYNVKISQLCFPK